MYVLLMINDYICEAFIHQSGGCFCNIIVCGFSYIYDYFYRC